MTTPMICASCASRCSWPKDFPISHYAVCHACHNNAERQAIENRSHAFFVGLGIFSILFVVTLGIVLVEC